jgi:hypothetical protein
MRDSGPSKRAEPEGSLSQLAPCSEEERRLLLMLQQKLQDRKGVLSTLQTRDMVNKHHIKQVRVAYVYSKEDAHTHTHTHTHTQHTHSCTTTMRSRTWPRCMLCTCRYLRRVHARTQHQMLLGKLAETEGVRTRDLYAKFGLDLDD